MNPSLEMFDVEESVCQEMDELDRTQQEQQSNLMVDMKKEMTAMQKKILMDCVSNCLVVNNLATS